MSPFLSMCKVSARWCLLALGISIILGTPSAALSQTALTWAKVERLRNRVHLIPRGQRARLASVNELMSIDDALRTASASRAELRFNDGSLARVGEQATFRFTPNTRNFQLSNGTVLLLIPPGRGRTTIQTPNAVTGIQGSALFVRVRCLAELSAEGYCSSPITFVGALTNNPAGAMQAFSASGSQQQPIYAGEIVVIEGDDITQRFEFDLRTFYQTSGLVEGLKLDSPTPPAELPEDLHGVWQEIQDALKSQGNFDDQGPLEEIVENPFLISPTLTTHSNDELELDNRESASTFAGFPSFASSPASAFHTINTQVATSQSDNNHTQQGAPETQQNRAAEATSLVDPITSARIRANLGGPAGGNQPSQSVISSPPPSAPVTQPASQVPSVATVGEQRTTATTPEIIPTANVSSVEPPTNTAITTQPPATSSGPAPIAETTPSTVVNQPATTSVVTSTPPVGPATPPVNNTPAPANNNVVTTVPAPAAEPSPPTTNQQPTVNQSPNNAVAGTNLPILEADQIPATTTPETGQSSGRQTAPTENFNWNQNTGSGASNASQQQTNSTENGSETSPLNITIP